MYTPIYLKTNYSFLESTIRIEKLIDFAVSKNFKYVCITDINMIAVMEFYHLAKKNNLIPVVGLEISLNSLKLLAFGNYYSLIKLATLSSEKELEIDVIVKDKVISMADKYIYKNEVINPNTWKIKKYLTRDRKISTNIFNKFLSGNKFVQDGRDNLRFRLSDLKTGEIIGAEVKGIDISRKFQMILPGSEGYFFIKNSNIIENIIFFEAAIDLISYYELENFSSDQQEDSFYNFPIKRKNSLYISLAGSYTKIEKCFEVLVKEKLINSSTNIIIATDNDKSGNELFNFFQKKGCKKLIRELPNQGVPYVNNGIKKTINDWNELLQIIKEEED